MKSKRIYLISRLRGGIRALATLCTMQTNHRFSSGRASRTAVTQHFSICWMVFFGLQLLSLLLLVLMVTFVAGGVAARDHSVLMLVLASRSCTPADDALYSRQESTRWWWPGQAVPGRERLFGG